MKVVFDHRVDRSANTFGPASGVLCVAAAVVIGIGTPIDRLEAQDKGLVPGRMWAARISASSIVLTWLTNPKAKRYKLFACSVSDCTVAKLLGTVGAATTRFIATVAGMTGAQRFAIEAVDEKGLTSGKVLFNTITVDKSAVATTPPAPASVTAAESGNRITVTWDAVPGATGYFIGRSIAPGGFQTICRLCPTETSFVDSTIKSGSKHIYTIGAYTAAGISRRTSSNAVTPGTASAVDVPGPIAAPSGGKAVATSPTAVTITWDKSANATGYQVYRSIDGQAFQLLVTVGEGVASFIDHWLPNYAGVIRYGVTILTGKGPPSAMLEIPFDKAALGTSALPPPPVTNAGGTYTATGIITLTWNYAPTATGYRIERSLSGGAWQTVAELPMTDSSWVEWAPGVFKQNPKYQIFTLVGTKASQPVVFVLVPAPKG